MQASSRAYGMHVEPIMHVLHMATMTTTLTPNIHTGNRLIAYGAICHACLATSFTRACISTCLARMFAHRTDERNRRTLLVHLLQIRVITQLDNFRCMRVEFMTLKQVDVGPIPLLHSIQQGMTTTILADLAGILQPFHTVE